MKIGNKSGTSSLRQKAEELLKNKMLRKADQLTDADVLKLIHELEVHMIEVELQNDELLLGAATSATDAEKFLKLYEFSPSGYLTLSSEGKIIQLNHKGAALIGKEHGKLINSMFGFFVSDDTRPVFNLFLKKIFSSKDTKTCEVVINREDGTSDHLFLKGLAQNERSCMVTATIITEIKLLERALISREERLQMAIDATGFGTYSFDFDSGISTYSKEFLDIYGLEPNDSIELDSDLVPKALHPEDKNYFLTSMNSANDPSGTGILNIEFRIFHTDRTIRWIKTTGLTVFSGSKISDRPVYANGIIQDITAQKKAEYELKRSEERFRLLFDSSPDGVVLIGTSGLIESANLAQSRMYGCESPEELTGTSPTLLIAPSMRDYSAGIMKRRLNGEEIPPVEYDLVRRDGTIFKGETSGTILRNEDNSVAGYICVTRNTTARLLEKQALKASDEKFRLSFMTSRDAIYIATLKEGRLIDVNDAFKDVFGYSRDECIGKTSLQLGLYADPQDRQKMVSELKEKGSVKELEFKGVRKGGEIITVSLSVSLLTLENKLHILGVIRDITIRKKIEEDLRNSEAEFRSLFENSLMAISQASPDGKLIRINRAYAEMYGYQDTETMLTELSGEILKLYANPNDRIKVLDILDEKGFMSPIEIELNRRNGEKFWALVGARKVMDSSGNLLYVQAEHIDITTRKKAQNELENSRELLEQLNLYLQRVREEERKRISRELHDELGQELTAIKIDIGILKNHLGTQKQIVPKIDKISSLLNDSIITVQRLTSELRPHILDDLGLVAAIDWYIKEYIERTGIAIDINIDKSIILPSEIELVIFRIFQESLTNIARHSKADNVEIIFYRQKSDVILEIKDDGIGISMVDRKSPKSLGLLNMSERARDIGGKFVIESRKKKGTRICLTVPDILFEE